MLAAALETVLYSSLNYLLGTLSKTDPDARTAFGATHSCGNPRVQHNGKGPFL